VGFIGLTPGNFLSRIARAIVGVAGGLIGLGGGGAATSPDIDGGGVVDQPIIDIGGGILLPNIQAIPDNTIILMAGMILLAVYGGWSLIRGRRA
jgi:hypothetical protein